MRRLKRNDGGLKKAEPISITPAGAQIFYRYKNQSTGCSAGSRLLGTLQVQRIRHLN
jgi:hypothetical protein